jgi:TolA-binding protein
VGKAKLHAAKLNILELVESDKDSEAQAATDRFIADFKDYDFRDRQEFPEVLYDIAGIYERSKKYDKATGLYQQIMQQHSDSKYAVKAQMDIVGMNIFSLVRTGNDAAVQAEINKLKADFPGHRHLPEVIYMVAKEYYLQANRLENEGLAEQSRSHLQKAISIYEALINEFPNCDEVPDAYCWIGQFYRQLGDYQKSIESCQKVVDDYPDFRFVWDALRTVGLNYIKLKEAGVISESEADAKTKAAFEKLLEEYPTCPAAKYAADWLNEHNAK